MLIACQNSWVAGIFRGERPGHLKAIMRPLPAGGPDGEGPRTITKFHFCKRCKVLENESIFSKKNFEKLNTFYNTFWIFRKIIWKYSIFMIPYKSKEILCEFEYLIEKFRKRSSKNS